jgi:hypothetical protein
MPTNPALDDIRLIFEFTHFLPVLVECLALFRTMAFDGLLKGPTTFFDLFRMFEKTFEG